MSGPLCPNCREHLSSVEHGYGGVWSCLYCEGTWLSARQFEATMAAVAAVDLAAAQAGHAAAAAWKPECPDCAPLRLEAASCGPVLAHRCANCRGAFLGKGLLATHAPQVACRDGEAPVAKGLLALIGSFALLDPLPYFLAFRRSRRKARPR